MLRYTRTVDPRKNAETGYIYSKQIWIFHGIAQVKPECILFWLKESSLKPLTACLAVFFYS